FLVGQVAVLSRLMLVGDRRHACPESRQCQQQQRQLRPGITANPLTGSSEPADRPGLDRLALQKALQVVGQVLGRLEAVDPAAYRRPAAPGAPGGFPATPNSSGREATR